MAITRAAGPPDGLSRVAAALPAMPPSGLEGLEAGGAEGPQISQPIATFAVDLEDMAQSGMGAIDRARQTGWRYLTKQGAELSLVDLPEREDGADEAELLISGEAGGQLAASGRLAEELARDGGDYEARILDLNLIGDSVLWLRARDLGEDDRFVSLGPEPHEIEGDQLVAKLERAAAAKLTSMRAAEGEAGG